MTNIDAYISNLRDSRLSKAAVESRNANAITSLEDETKSITSTMRTPTSYIQRVTPKNAHSKSKVSVLTLSSDGFCIIAILISL
jgi:hypothetical protein